MKDLHVVRMMMMREVRDEPTARQEELSNHARTTVIKNHICTRLHCDALTVPLIKAVQVQNNL